MATKRILVVDDSCMYQRLLSDVINQHIGMEVVGVASDGKCALESIPTLKPDLVTLDILMPELDGIQTMMELRRKWPDIRTIMVSSLTSEGSDVALDALALGASEYVAKPSAVGGVSSIRQALGDDLLPKIEALCGIDQVSATATSHIKSVIHRQTGSTSRIVSGANRIVPEIVAIGVSTGGPDALAKVLVQLPADLEVPVVVVQHMPAEFTAKLAARLDAASALTVKEAEIGDCLQAGTVYIAPGDYHMVLESFNGAGAAVRLNQNAPENSCRPSVDPLFRSVATLYGERSVGIIMTGMGQDGLKGSEALFAAGSSILVQDEASSIVWGMPKLVAMAGLAEEQVPLNQIAMRIVDRVRPARHSQGTVGNQSVDAANSSAFKKNIRGGEVQ